MQSTEPQNLLTSAGYAICSIADLAIHIERLAGKGLVTRRAVGCGAIIGIIRLYKYLGMMGLSVGVNTHSHIKKGGRLLRLAILRRGVGYFPYLVRSFIN
jgi:hypothetical protein